LEKFLACIMAAFLTKLFVGQLPFGVHKAYLWAIGFLCLFSGLLYGGYDLLGSVNGGAVAVQVRIDLLVLALLAVLLLVNYCNSLDSLRTLLWDGLNPVAWFFIWLLLAGFIDNYTRFPFIVVGLVAFVLQIVLIGAFVRSSLRSR
jgi:hypothetical protein